MAKKGPTQMSGTGETRLFVIIFFSYLATGYLGLQLSAVYTFASLLWAPIGIAFAAFIFYGYRVWPGIFLAAFLLNSALDAPPASALIIGIGNTVGPLFGTYLLKWYSGFMPPTMRLRDTIGIVANAFLVPVITASVGAGSLWLGGAIPSGAFQATWSTWWVGDMLGILIGTPFILKWFTAPVFKRTALQYAELLLSSFLLAVFALPVAPSK